MQSHILLPKCIFKEFVNKQQYYYKYEIKTKKIIKGYPKRTYTEENYYSEKMEKYLNKKIETPLNKLLDFAKKLPTLPLPVEVKPEIYDIAWAYIISLYARSPILYNKILEESIFLKYEKQQTQHDIVVKKAFDSSTLNQIINIYEFTFMINKTSTPFVLPTRGLYEFRVNNISCMNIPLNPYCAIFLIQKGKKISKTNHEINGIASIPYKYDSRVMELNKYAFEKQNQDSIGYVISDNKKVLENF